MKNLQLLTPKPQPVLWDCLVSDDSRYAFIGAIEIDGSLCAKAVLIVEPCDRVYVQANEIIYTLTPTGETLNSRLAVITPDPGCDYVRVPIQSKAIINYYIPPKHTVKVIQDD